MVSTAEKMQGKLNYLIKEVLFLLLVIIYVPPRILFCFQRCKVMRIFYFSYKQVKHDFSLLRAYAIISGRFNITVN